MNNLCSGWTPLFGLCSANMKIRYTNHFVEWLDSAN